MAGGSSGGHGFGVQKQKEEKRDVAVPIYRTGSKEALANDLQRLGRNEQHSRQRISHNTNQRQETRKQPMEMRRLQRMDATPNQRMTQTTRDNRKVLEDAFRKTRKNKT